MPGLHKICFLSFRQSGDQTGMFFRHPESPERFWEIKNLI